MINLYKGIEYVMKGTSKQHIDISIVIPNYNSTSYLLRCLSGIFEQKAECNYEVIVVDSSDGNPEAEVKKKFPDVNFIHSPVFGCSNSNVLACNACRGRILKQLSTNCLYFVLFDFS